MTSIFNDEHTKASASRLLEHSSAKMTPHLTILYGMLRAAVFEIKPWGMSDLPTYIPTGSCREFFTIIKVRLSYTALKFLNGS